jgi:hypothetical protein
MRLSERKRRTLASAALVAAGVGTLIGASVVSRQFFEGPTRNSPPHHPQLASAATTVTLFRVAAVQGGVEALHNGQWYVVQAGDLLPVQDLIRTNKGASALLRRGGTEIEVREDVDIRLEQLANPRPREDAGSATTAAAPTASFDLVRGGNVVASVDDPNEKLQITAGGTRAVNDGVSRFVVQLSADGSVTVGTAKGEVLFAAKGKQVSVTAGHESTARSDHEPGEPQSIPEELLLSVMWPEIDHAEAHAQVQGKVRPSSRVKVNGVDAQIHADGRFAASIPLAVGPNKIEVEAQDILGHKKAVNKVIKRPPPLPTLEPTEEDLWKR